MPDAPLNPILVAGSGYVQAKWLPPGYDGGAPVTAYSAVALDHQTHAVTKWINTTADTRSVSIPGLTNGRLPTTSWSSCGTAPGPATQRPRSPLFPLRRGP